MKLFKSWVERKRNLLFTFIFIVIPEKLRWGESSACFLGIYNDSVSIKLYFGEGGLEFSSPLSPYPFPSHQTALFQLNEVS